MNPEPLRSLAVYLAESNLPKVRALAEHYEEMHGTTLHADITARYAHAAARAATPCRRLVLPPHAAITSCRHLVTPSRDAIS